MPLPPASSRNKLLLAILLAWLAVLPIGPSPAAGGTLEPRAWLPLIALDDGKPMPQVTLSGAPVPGTVVEMHIDDDGNFTTLEAVTDADGRYAFRIPPERMSADRYWVTWSPAVIQEGLLRSWTCEVVNGPPSAKPGCSFDIAAAPALSPDGGQVALPSEFRWQARGLDGDQYGLIFFDLYQTTKILYRTGPLSASDAAVLASTGPNMQPNLEYRWAVEVFRANGSGISSGDKLVRFLP